VLALAKFSKLPLHARERCDEHQQGDSRCDRHIANDLRVIHAAIECQADRAHLAAAMHHGKRFENRVRGRAALYRSQFARFRLENGQPYHAFVGGECLAEHFGAIEVEIPERVAEHLCESRGGRLGFFAQRGLLKQRRDNGGDHHDERERRENCRCHTAHEATVDRRRTRRRHRYGRPVPRCAARIPAVALSLHCRASAEKTPFDEMMRIPSPYFCIAHFAFS
jgi:hypothetical protein